MPPKKAGKPTFRSANSRPLNETRGSDGRGNKQSNELPPTDCGVYNSIRILMHTNNNLAMRHKPVPNGLSQNK
jgi:hypothetical protein